MALPTWLSWKNGRWLIATLAIPITVGYVSYQYEKSSAERQAADARLRLYTELLSRREEADTSVRKGIFDKVLETYLKPGGEDLEQKLVALELLALNFHESLDLSPLFWQLDRQITRAPAPQRDELRAHLERIARDVKERQVEILEGVGAKRDGSVDFEELARAPVPLFDEELAFADPDPLAEGRTLKRRFTAEVIERDGAGRRLLVRAHDGKAQWVFWVDPFDFPLVEFVRISKAERLSAVLRAYGPGSAQLTFIYFPSSRSGLKDKPFIDEVISDLRRHVTE
jgi:hypothetical protein